jgi:hypothetical protein
MQELAEVSNFVSKGNQALSRQVNKKIGNMQYSFRKVDPETQSRVANITSQVEFINTQVTSC